MAKQKAAPGKKASKTKTERTGSAKAASAANKRPGPAAKAAPSKTQTSTSTVAKKKSTPAPTPAKKAAPLKAAAKTPKLKEAPAARATVQRKPPEKAAKPVSRPAAEVSPKKDDSSRTSKPVAVSEKAKPASKAPVGKRMPQKAAKASNAAATAVKPAPRILGNGQLAGVLQAARSVASKTNKVVEVEKERKSHLTAEELAEFRQILLDKRRELVDDMVNLEDEARRTGSEGGPGSSVMPIHMADLGSDTWEQEFTLNLIEKERTIVREIDEALDRIEKRTYGTCLATGKSISKARLRVKPWAKYCIEYARKRELGLT